MAEENISQEFTLKYIDETRNHFLEIKQYELMSRSTKSFVQPSNNLIKHFHILASTTTGCISISVFASLLGIPIGIKSSVVGFKICTITARIKR